MAVMALSSKSGAVGGLIVFGTTTSLFAKIGELFKMLLWQRGRQQCRNARAYLDHV